MIKARSKVGQIKSSPILWTYTLRSCVGVHVGWGERTRERKKIMNCVSPIQSKFLPRVELQSFLFKNNILNAQELNNFFCFCCCSCRWCCSCCGCCCFPCSDFSSHLSSKTYNTQSFLIFESFFPLSSKFTSTWILV